MKKLVSLLLALAMLLSTCAMAESVADLAKAAESMTHDELVAKAQAEEGTFVVYGNTSRIVTAAENFSALYGIPLRAAT